MMGISSSSLSLIATAEFSEEKGSLYVFELIKILEDLSSDLDLFFIGEGRATNSGLTLGSCSRLGNFFTDADFLRGLESAGGWTNLSTKFSIVLFSCLP